MGSHRADVDVDSRTAETPLPPAAAPSTTSEPASQPVSTPARGKRRADVPVVEAPAPATAYAGKRRAHPAESAVEPLAEAIAMAPEPVQETAVALRAVDATVAIQAVSVEAVDATAVRLVERDEIEPTALVEADDVPEVERTTFVPRIRYDEAAESTRVPAPRSPYELGESLRPLFAEDSRVDLPRVTLDIAADFTGDTTSTIPVVADGKRRAKKTRRRRASVPMLAGAAALLVAAGGAVTTAQGALGSAFGDQLVAADAFTGSSAVASVGTRGVTISRDSNRVDLADQAAQQRTAALTKLDAQAAGQDQWLTANQWTTPILAGQYVLTARFGQVSGLWATIHTGLDFACPDGTPIHAVASGTITQTGWAGSYGNLTVETLPDGTQLWYAHQSRFGSTVGEKVTEGEVIGYVGATGNVTGPHVHLEVRPGGGDPVDPDAALRAHGVNPDAEQG